MEQLRIKLMTIGVLSAPSEEALDSALENQLEFFVAPGKDSEIPSSTDLDYGYQYTNEYWNLVPELEVECDLDADRVWQQVIWTIEGEFEIPAGMSTIEAVSKVGWELSIEDNDDEVELDEFYWHVVKVTRVAN